METTVSPSAKTERRRSVSCTDGLVDAIIELVDAAYPGAEQSDRRKWLRALYVNIDNYLHGNKNTDAYAEVIAGTTERYLKVNLSSQFRRQLLQTLERGYEETADKESLLEPLESVYDDAAIDFAEESGIELGSDEPLDPNDDFPILELNDMWTVDEGEEDPGQGEDDPRPDAPPSRPK